MTAETMLPNSSTATVASTAFAPRIINQLHIDAAKERARLIAGLRAPRATIEPKYFYDTLGCAIYGAICQSDEYYPTRTERGIFQTHRLDIAAEIGALETFIDLGAGDCCKALSWLPMLNPKRYLAVDIAGPELHVALSNMQPDFAETELIGLVTDFSEHLSIPRELVTGKSVIFYPGSSIGNFVPSEAVRFMREMRAVVAPHGGGLLIGVDAKKDKRILDAAYDDALGLTAAFNLNALRHINRTIGSNFDVAQWQHRGFYNAAEGRIEMHLESRVDQTVMIDGAPRVFRQGEGIHSENSYKYSQNEFESLLREAGFAHVRCWSNEVQSFWVFYAH